jgi:hypothetical protein
VLGVTILVLLGAGSRVVGDRTGALLFGELAYSCWYLAVGFGAWFFYRPLAALIQRVSDRFGDLVNRSSPFLLIICAVGCAGFLASAPGRARSILSDPHASNALFSVFLSALVGTVGGLVQLTPRHRAVGFRRLHPIGWLGPAVVIGCFLVCSVGLFTWDTVYSGVHFTGVADVEALPVHRVAAFYLWHLVDLLPLGEPPKTLRWAEPLRYDGSDIGMRVLAFQALTVGTTVATVRAYWAYVHSPEARRDGVPARSAVPVGEMDDDGEGGAEEQQPGPRRAETQAAAGVRLSEAAAERGSERVSEHGGDPEGQHRIGSTHEVPGGHSEDR